MATKGPSRRPELSWRSRTRVLFSHPCFPAHQHGAVASSEALNLLVDNPHRGRAAADEAEGDTDTAGARRCFEGPRLNGAEAAIEQSQQDLAQLAPARGDLRAPQDETESREGTAMDAAAEQRGLRRQDLGAAAHLLGASAEDAGEELAHEGVFEIGPDVARRRKDLRFTGSTPRPDGTAGRAQHARHDVKSLGRPRLGGQQQDHQAPAG